MVPIASADTTWTEKPASETRWVWPILVLAFCHLVAIASAQIVNILVDDVRASLAITDVQYSLLQGVAVALFAALVGIPVARLADRKSRRVIIMVGVAGWTAATVACRLAQTFGQLFVARACVGIGEVFLFPAAASLIMDLVPRDKLARATALFGCGGPIGVAVALSGGGWLLGHKAWIAGQPMLRTIEPWRIAFLGCAVLGIIALALLTTVREPARDPSVALDAEAAAEGNVFAHLLGHAGLYGTALGGMLALTTAVFATGAWLPTVLIRDRGLSATEAGSLSGIAALIFAVAGTWAAGAGTDRVNRGGRLCGVLYIGMVTGGLLLVAAVMLALSSGHGTLLTAMVCVLFLVQGAPTVLCATAIQQIAPPYLRAQVMAVYVLLVGVIAAIVGPSSVALLHAQLFTAPMGLGLSLSFVLGIAGVLAIGLFVMALPRFAAARRVIDAGQPA